MNIIFKYLNFDFNRNINYKPITPNYLYVIIYNNRYDMLSILKKKSGIINIEENININVSATNSEEEMVYSLETIETSKY